MKTIIKYTFCYLLILLIIFYVATISEGMEVLAVNSFSLTKSFEYFFLWVIPYWWFILIIISLILTSATIGIKKLKRGNT